MKDGWYVDPAGLGTPHSSYLFGSYLIGGYACRDRVVDHGNLSSPGYPVLETYNSVRRELIEMSNSPLDKELFEIPAHLRQVDSLPNFGAVSGRQRFEFEWQQLERAFQTWFE